MLLQECHKISITKVTSEVIYHKAFCLLTALLSLNIKLLLNFLVKSKTLGGDSGAEEWKLLDLMMRRHVGHVVGVCDEFRVEPVFLLYC